MNRLLLFDLDGTLLRPDKTISPVNLQALDDCRRAGTGHWPCHRSLRRQRTGVRPPSTAGGAHHQLRRLGAGAGRNGLSRRVCPG